jgi:hypothetical protein
MYHSTTKIASDVDDLAALFIIYISLRIGDGFNLELEDLFDYSTQYHVVSHVLEKYESCFTE